MYRMFDDCKEEGVILTVDENYTLRKFTFEDEYGKVRLEQVGIPCLSSYFKRNVLF